MSIPMNWLCIRCHLNRTLELAQPLGSDEQLTQLAKGLLQMYLDAPDHASSPYLGPETNRLLQEIYGISSDRMKKEKESSNRFVLDRLESIHTRIQQAQDPVFAALQFSILGNYLDFAALQGQVSFDTLDKMLDEASQIELDQKTYLQFCDDLQKNDRLLVLTDNAGEIVFDMVLAQYIQKAYPHLNITFCVRGGPTHNDATLEDATAIGLPFHTIHNGNTVGGTELSLLSGEAREAMEVADVIIAKGMGNTETLAGCGYNIYYAFLVKCQRFVQYFNKPMMTPLFLSERSVCHPSA